MSDGAEHLSDLHALLAEPERLARSVAKNVELDTDGPKITVGLLASAWEIYSGIRLLLERRLAAEALMLSRTLLHNAALLMWFKTRSDELEVLALRYYWSSVTYSYEVAAAARANGWAWAEKMFQARAEEIAEIRRAANARGMEKPEGLPKTRDLLTELNQGRLYYLHAKAG
jgi:hypothetical protein